MSNCLAGDCLTGDYLESKKATLFKSGLITHRVHRYISVNSELNYSILRAASTTTLIERASVSLSVA